MELTNLLNSRRVSLIVSLAIFVLTLVALAAPWMGHRSRASPEYAIAYRWARP